jgi:dihydrofolate reductase
MGRKTFNDMAAYWPSSTEVFAAPMNEIPKIVFSVNGFDPFQPSECSVGTKNAILNRADSGDAAAYLPASAKSWKEPKMVTGDLAAGIRQLKAENGKELLAHCGASFAQSLTQTGLVDE